MKLKRKCPWCEATFWRWNSEMIHFFMAHGTDLKRRLDAATEAFKREPDPGSSSNSEVHAPDVGAQGQEEEGPSRRF